jgi:hypothetical protein
LPVARKSEPPRVDASVDSEDRIRFHTAAQGTGNNDDEYDDDERPAEPQTPELKRRHKLEDVHKRTPEESEREAKVAADIVNGAIQLCEKSLKLAHRCL